MEYYSSLIGFIGIIHPLLNAFTGEEGYLNFLLYCLDYFWRALVRGFMTGEGVPEGDKFRVLQRFNDSIYM